MQQTEKVSIQKFSYFLLSLEIKQQLEESKVTPEQIAELKAKYKAEKEAKKEEMKKQWEEEKQRRKEEREKVCFIYTWKLKIHYGRIQVGFMRIGFHSSVNKTLLRIGKRDSKKEKAWGEEWNKEKETRRTPQIAWRKGQN